MPTRCASTSAEAPRVAAVRVSAPGVSVLGLSPLGSLLGDPLGARQVVALTVARIALAARG